MTKLLVVGFAAAAVTGAALALQVKRWRELVEKLMQMEATIEQCQKQRIEERTGRIRAQRELRKNLMATNAFPMTPIGHIRSCFSTRNGTPRQPLLVQSAKASLVLCSDGISPSALEGLEQYSHCWILYVFHENTDLPNLWSQPSHKDFKAKVRVPRLGGEKLGVFATRSPHRPCPIGLTVAKVEQVFKGTLLISGADIVDGTPVLDVKPYLPYCDSVRNSSAPSWVKVGGMDDLLAVASVEFTEEFNMDLEKCWNQMGKKSLYSSTEEIKELVKEVLSRDIRSLNQRNKPHNGVLSEVAEPLYGGAAIAGSYVSGDVAVTYHVVLDGIKVSYIMDGGGVLVRSASVPTFSS